VGRYRNAGKNARVIPVRRGVVLVLPGAEVELPDEAAADLVRGDRLVRVDVPAVVTQPVAAPVVVAPEAAKLTRKQRRQGAN
jgi:hypothetical protein